MKNPQKNSLQTSKPIRKKSKRDIVKIQGDIWNLCKLIIRKKYVNECYTCDAKNLSGRNHHTGHMIPKSVCKVQVKYDLRNLRPQCMACNNHRGGMGAEFIKRMIVRDGQEYVDGIYADNMQQTLSGKASYAYYELLFAKYQIQLEEMN